MTTDNPAFRAAEEYEQLARLFEEAQSNITVPAPSTGHRDVIASALRIASRVDEDELARVLCDRMEVGGSGFASYSDRRREPWRQYARAIISYLKGGEG